MSTSFNHDDDFNNRSFASSLAIHNEIIDYLKAVLDALGFDELYFLRTFTVNKEARLCERYLLAATEILDPDGTNTENRRAFEWGMSQHTSRIKSTFVHGPDPTARAAAQIIKGVAQELFRECTTREQQRTTIAERDGTTKARRKLSGLINTVDSYEMLAKNIIEN